MKRKPIKNESLILYIKKHDKFYEFSNLSGHSRKELQSIKLRIEKDLLNVHTENQ